MTAIERVSAAWGAAFQRPPHRISVENEGTAEEQVTVDGHVVYRCEAGWGLATQTYLPSYAWDVPPALDVIPVGEWATLDEAIAALLQRASARRAREPDPDSPV